MAKRTPDRKPRRILIGFWHDTGELYSHPQELVDHAWEVARRSQIIAYLKSGHVWSMGAGYSYCRFGCTQPFWRRKDDPSQTQYRLEWTEEMEKQLEGTNAHEVISRHYIETVGRMLNGCLNYCDDLWCWPERLAHYVETHGIRLPDEFVAHAAARAFQPFTVMGEESEIVAVDTRFWTQWLQRRAPFQHEPNCNACTARPAPIPSRRRGVISASARARRKTR